MPQYQNEIIKTAIKILIFKCEKCTNFQVMQIQTVSSSSLQHLPTTRAYGLHF